MRSVGSILLAILFLLSGMHLTLSTHFCKGQPVASKISFTGIKATCGMESEKSALPSKGILIKANCCSDDVRVFKVESLFSYSVCDFKVVPQKSLPYPGIPVNILPVLSYNQKNYSDHSPPDYCTLNSVHVEEICSFRI